MSQYYSDPSRAEDPHALPDVEVFQEDTMECDHCGSLFPDQPFGLSLICPSCNKRTRAACKARGQWWWWACSPGCLPDGDPVGPFDTEKEAVEASRMD